MIRYFVLLFNMVGVLLFRTFFVDNVTVKQNLPAKANPGDEFTVEVTINKGDLAGFAQLKCEIPEGLTATAGDVNGSEFKFSGQIVRFTWTSLPGDPTLKVSYKVKVAPGTSGVKSFTGKFSYVLNNVKNSIELNASEITIGTPVVDNVDNTVTTTPTTTTTNTTTTTTNTTTPPPDTTTKTVTTTNNTTTTPTDNTNKTTGVANVSAIRKVQKDAKPGDEFVVEVTLNKGNLKGFARFQDVMPEGFTASAGDPKGGTFSFVDQKAKIVWDNIPGDEQIVVTYKVKVSSAALGDQTIEGLFSYVENDEPKKFVITPSTITVDKPVDNTLVNNNTTTTTNDNTNTTNTNNTNTNTTNTNTTNTNTTNTNTVTDNTNTTNTNTVTDNTNTKTQDNTIPPPSTSVTYKVQICAAHNTVDGSYFQNRYGISSKINIESHEGWVKYTTGSFPVYKDARDSRESIRNKGVDGPFVTAYNKGTRITVQEALMISAQQWYK